MVFTDWDSFQYLDTDLVLIQLFYKDIPNHLAISFIFTDRNSYQYTCTDLVPFRSFLMQNIHCMLFWLNFSLCHDLKEILRVTNFFIICVKCDCYNSGSGAQVLVVINFKLHWF